MKGKKVAGCNYAACPSKDCIRRLMSEPVKLEFETYVPDTKCVFHIPMPKGSFQEIGKPVGMKIVV